MLSPASRLVIATAASLFLVLVVVGTPGALGGTTAPTPAPVPEDSKGCVMCHAGNSPGIVEQWRASTHAEAEIGCVDCHDADASDVDGFDHHGARIATVVTPRDCAQCHADVEGEFSRSHHAKAGNILASLDNYLAETVEGMRGAFNPHSPTPGKAVVRVNGMASANSGCTQCHGSRMALVATDGGKITADDLKPGPDGRSTNPAAVARVARDAGGRPQIHADTWPNTGIGRINLDGSLGSCSACHSRHDFSPRRARQPENCGKCHLGPDHPQKEIYEESKHGVAYRDLREKMNLDADSWVLGTDYSQAPTCATCHMSGNKNNGGRITHDPGERISWTNRPPVSLVMDTDKDHKVITATDPAERAKLTVDSAVTKRGRMKEACVNCHSPAYVDAFYTQYDDLVVLFNEKFAKPGAAIMAALGREGLVTEAQFDESIEWTWFYLWHHEGRRARHGAAMMAPDYTHWHGMYEVAERFYEAFIPEVEEILAEAAASGKVAEAARVRVVLESTLSRPEHRWIKPPDGER